MSSGLIDVTADFETFFDVGYSVAGKGADALSTSEYIRDERFEAMLCAIKIDDHPTEVFAGDEIADALHSMPWDDINLIAHHTHFDGYILSERYDIVPANYSCTLSMARGVLPLPFFGLDPVAKYLEVGSKIEGTLLKMKGKRLADLTPEELEQFKIYCANDNDTTKLVYNKLLPQFQPGELEIIDLTLRCFCDPILMIDVDRAQAEYEREVRDKAKIIGASPATLEVLMSNPKFAEFLQSIGVEPPTKRSKKTGEKAWAFAKSDLDFQALEHHPDPRVQAAVKARIRAKSTIGETRADRFVTTGTTGKRTFPIYYGYCAAHTTRWGGGDKRNPQNLPSIEYDEKGKPIPLTGELRKSIVAPPGHVIMVKDSSQIEARTNLWNAEQEDGLAIFREGGDPYAVLASDVYGRPINKKTDPNERFVGKVGVLGLGYQMGAPRFQNTLATGMMGPPLDLPLDICYRVVETYRKKNDKIVGFWETCTDILWDMDAGNEGEWKAIRWEKGRIWLPNGLPLLYPELKTHWRASDNWLIDASYKNRRQRSHIYGGLLCENIIQALARAIVAEQMLRIRAAFAKIVLLPGEYLRICMTTHDEVVAVVPVRLIALADEIMTREMSTPPAWCPDLPVACEGGYAPEYSK